MPRERIPVSHVRDAKAARDAATRVVRRKVRKWHGREPSATEVLDESELSGESKQQRLLAAQSARGSQRPSQMLPLQRLVDKATFRAQVLSPEAIFAFLYFSLNLLRFNFYLATGADQLEALGDSGDYKRIFPWMPPLGFVE